jgi:hypothetical protein
MDVDELLGFAERLLSKPAAPWNDLHAAARIKLQRVVFPKGLPFDGAAFGTAETPVVSTFLARKPDEERGMVGDTGRSPNFCDGA